MKRKLAEEENMSLRCAISPNHLARLKPNDNINLQVRKGEIHALLGENGAGKSILMNVLSGLLQPTSGEILMNGQKVDIQVQLLQIS